MNKWYPKKTPPKHSGSYLVCLDGPQVLVARYSTHYRDWRETSPGIEVSYSLNRELRYWTNLPDPPPEYTTED